MRAQPLKLVPRGPSEPTGSEGLRSLRRWAATSTCAHGHHAAVPIDDGPPALRPAVSLDLLGRHARSCAVAAAATAAGVRLLALTDHDTVAGVSAAQAAGARHDIAIVPAIEVSGGRARERTSTCSATGSTTRTTRSRNAWTPGAPTVRHGSIGWPACSRSSACRPSAVRSRRAARRECPSVSPPPSREGRDRRQPRPPRSRGARGVLGVPGGLSLP